MRKWVYYFNIYYFAYLVIKYDTLFTIMNKKTDSDKGERNNPTSTNQSSSQPSIREVIRTGLHLNNPIRPILK